MATLDVHGWLVTNGGPFAILSRKKRESWGGDLFSSSTVKFPPVDNDYTRACRYGSIEGIISDDDGEALVIFTSGQCGTTATVNGVPSLIFYEVSGEDIVVDEDSIQNVNFTSKSKELLLKINFQDSEICMIDSADCGKGSLFKTLNMSPVWKDVYKCNKSGYLNETFCGEFIVYEFVDMIFDD